MNNKHFPAETKRAVMVAALDNSGGDTKVQRVTAAVPLVIDKHSRFPALAALAALNAEAAWIGSRSDDFFRKVALSAL